MRHKRDKFISLAESRVNRAINDIRLIANLATRGTMSTRRKKLKKIIAILEDAVKKLKFRFTSERQTRGTFRLK